ncbi:hypothetical protein B7L09_07175 [Pseudomonas mandelii]|jgi:hypothetical protein|uniref:hypothetical protein n=1 Tax=Pseudomonas TaxID=286 RepID=UPI000B964184|nr:MULTISPECIES: hypothetical protein [Pseudomonas]OYQ23522.1 hypothetical protein B7L09_07175 [Pseudomonas mandelii]
MQSHDIRLPISQVATMADTRANHQAEFNNNAKPAGGVDMEPRVIELETHLKYIRRDMEEVRGDVKSIKHRLAYSAGGTAVVLGLLGWVANSRFDQVVSLLVR